MHIWDSVQRGLEKASHEAARITQVQRLRASVDTLNRQVSMQQGALLAKATEIYREGRMTQMEDNNPASTYYNASVYLTTRAFFFTR